MNGIFHAAVGVAIGGLALGDHATRSDLALCALAGTSPDWDAVLLFMGRPIYRRYHRMITHSFFGIGIAALMAGAFLAVFGGWEFGHVAFLWFLAALGHTVSDLFNRSGVALLSPFYSARTKFPAVSWASPTLTVGAFVVASGVVLDPASGWWIAVMALPAYGIYLVRRMREPTLSDPLSRWWFDQVCGFVRDGNAEKEYSSSVEPSLRTKVGE